MSQSLMVLLDSACLGLDLEFLMSVSLAHGYRIMTFTICQNNRVGQLGSNWPTKQGGSRGNTGRTMGCSTIVAKKLIHILFPVCSGAQYFPKGLHKSFHFSIGFGPQRRHLSVLETEISSELCANSLPLKGGPLSDFTT